MPVEKWYNAVATRKSRRNFTGEPLNEEHMNKLERLCDEFRPFNGVRAVLVREIQDRVFWRIIQNVPHYIALIGDMTSPTVQEVTGYQGEGLILEATSIGVSTCWIAGFYRQKTVMKEIDLSENEQVLAITPIGYSPDTKTRIERSISRVAKADRRKPLDQLLLPQSDELNDWTQIALKCARLSPSAANRQPWRFEIRNDSITISTDCEKNDRISRRLDCGIAMLHVELGAHSIGAKGTWEFLQSPQVARFTIDR